MMLRFTTALLATALLLGACSPHEEAGERRASPSATGAPVEPLRTTAPPTSAPPKATVGCPLFPADNIWHADVSKLPVHGQSRAYVASIGLTRRLHPDFGAGLLDGSSFGIPINEVPPGQRAVK